MAGEVRTARPSARRIAKVLWGHDFAILVGPPGSLPAATVTRAQTGPATQPPTGSTTLLSPSGYRGQAGETEVVAMAAAESARFAQLSEQSNVGPHTLEQFREDIERIVANYGNRPIYPTFVEVRELRNRAFELLEGRQPPGQTSDLYLIAGLLCAILGEASHDLGHIAAAKTQLRTAFLCGELAGNNWLRSWVRGQQAGIAYWDNQPRTAAELSADGWQYIPENGTARVHAATQEARAHARLRDQHSVDNALARAEQAREQVHGDDYPGGSLTFSPAFQSELTASVRLLLGGDANRADAEALAGQAMELYKAEPPERQQLGGLCHAQLKLATAQLRADNLEGTAANVGDVLIIIAQRPSETVSRLLTQIVNTLQRPHYENTTLALDLRDQIHTATTPAPLPRLEP
jgi:acylphosphatase